MGYLRHLSRASAGAVAVAAMLAGAVPAWAQDKGPPPASAQTAPAPPTPAKPQPPVSVKLPVAPAKPVAATPAKPPPAAAKEPVSPKQEADGILGKEVFSADGGNMGLVTNVLVNSHGSPIAVVIDFGGFLGVGSRKIAVDWHLMQFHPGDKNKPVTLSLQKEQLRAAPEYKPGKAPQIIVSAKAPVPAKSPTAGAPAPAPGKPAASAPGKPIYVPAKPARGTANSKPAPPAPAPASVKPVPPPKPVAVPSKPAQDFIDAVGQPKKMRGSGATRSAEYGLDVLNLFVANIQTGFGPFIAVYLTTRGWTQTSIGVALSVGTVVAMVSQVPAGALVDRTRRKSFVASLSLAAFTVSALLFAIRANPLPVYLAEVLHGFSSCTLGPAIAAMSLALAGQAGMSVRVGRNARYSSIGNATGAALMGAVGYYLSSRSVFVLAAVLTLPAIAAAWPLRLVDDRRIPPSRGRAPKSAVSVARLLRDRRLLIFAASVMLFTFGNAAMLPLASVTITERMPASANLLIAAFIMLPQLVVAVVSPRVGRYAQSNGRRNILILALAALVVRGLLFAAIANPLLLIAVQVLDGISAAGFGVLVPLVTSDVAAHSGHYNFALGLVGFGVGIGATLSTTIGGLIADDLGEPVAILCLSAAAVAALVFAWGLMPETRPGSRRAA